MADDEKAGKPAAGDDAAVAEIQAGAKWMVAALGAIAAILVAGVTLGDLGAVEGGRLVTTIAGVVVAAVAVMHLLHLTLDVLIAEPARLTDLGEADAAEFSSSLLAPASSLGDLENKINSYVQEAQLAYSAWAETSFTDADRETAFRAADGMALQWSKAGNRALSRLRLLNLQEDFKKFRDQVAVAGVFVLAGVTAAAWGLSGPHAEELSIASVVQTPTNIVVDFEDVDFSADIPDYAAIAGEPCVNANTAHEAVALAAEAQTYTLALVGSDECPAVVISVGVDEAQVALPKSD